MATQLADRPEVQFVGDGISGEWATWRWSDGAGPQVERIQGWQKARDELARALPPANPIHSRQLRFDRALAVSADERRMALEHGRSLIPESLRREILRRHEAFGGLLSFRIVPSPSTAHVPWGLLLLDEQTRLLDVADVSWIAPLTPRDLADGSADDAPLGAGLPPLFVIDPILREGDQILSSEAGDRWRDRLARHGPRSVHIHEVVTPERLGDWLRTSRSSLMLVGHCVSGRRRGETSFRMSEGSLLTPSDLVQRHLLADRGQAWRMPERAAIIACASGVDSLDHEPFGLPTAMFANGARTVLATLWPIPTDYGFEGNGAGPQFTRLTEAAEEALASPDPVASLNTWQRTRLAAWLDHPDADNAPLSWASLAVIHAPDRSLQRPG